MTRYSVKPDPGLFPSPRDRVLRAWAATHPGVPDEALGHVALCHLEPGNPWWPLSAYAPHGLPVELNHYHVERAHRGLGLGGRLLSAALGWATRSRLTVLCCPQPYSRGAMSLRDLQALYRAHGFNAAAPGVYVKYP